MALVSAHGASGYVHGAALLSPTAALAGLLIVVNDLWLKRFHPSWLSGKLSDVGLCILLPLATVAALEWLRASYMLLTRRIRGVDAAPAPPPVALDRLGCVIAAGYFVAVKIWPWATQAHVAWLAALFPRLRFAAVTDPSDLLTLPCMLLAWRTLRRRRARWHPASPAH